MSIQGESGPRRGAAGVAEQQTDFQAYASARERFFERLRLDAEIRRLERAWRLPSGDVASDRRGAGR